MNVFIRTGAHRGRRSLCGSVATVAVLAATMLPLAACGGAGTQRAASRPGGATGGAPARPAAAPAGPAGAAASSVPAQPAGSTAPAVPRGSRSPAHAGGSAAAPGRSGASGGSALSNVTPATAAEVGPGICVPFRQVLGFEAQRQVYAERSHTEQQAANQTLHSALEAMTSTLRGAAPAAVSGAIADLRKDAIVVTPQPVPGGAAHPVSDVLALRQYLEHICGGEPGTAAQEAGIRAAIAGWLPGTGGKPGCFSVSGIQVSRADAAYATADLVPSCQVPGGGTVLLHEAAPGAWKVVGVEQAIPCGQAPAPVLADLFGAVVPTLCGPSPRGTARVVAVKVDRSAGGYRVAGSYPQVAGLSGAGVEAAINGVLQRAVSAAEAAFAHDVATAGGTGTLTLSYQVAYLKAPYLSVRLDVLRSIGGTAHPSGTVSTFTFDLRSGYRYRLADLFRPGADDSGFLAGAARSQLDARYGPGTWKAVAAGAGPGLFDAWLLTGKGLEVTFNDAPSSLGQPTVTIPYDDAVLASLARPYTLPVPPA